MYSSSLERCVETAAPLAAARGLEVERLDTLRDTHYGTWTNRNISQIRGTKLWAGFAGSPADTRFPDGETIREVQARAVGEVASIVERHPRSVVAVFSHADPIQLVLAHYLGLHVDMYPRIVVSPASVSAVAAGGGMPRVLKVNDTGGLHDVAPFRPRKRGR
jgi:probable phosphoglycerate mutase